MKRIVAVLTAVILANVTLSGCLSGGLPLSGVGRLDMDMQDAAERSDEILDAVFEEIRPEVQWAHGPTTTGSCDVTRRRTVMTIVSKERRGSFLGLIDRLWRKSEYRIKAINKDAEFPAIYAQTKDGFGVSLSIGGAGQAFFEVDSPCVNESEVRDSTTPPNGPAYEGVYPLPRPNVRSDFWSAGAP